jgi:hypothetical protein
MRQAHTLHFNTTATINASSCHHSHVTILLSLQVYELGSYLINRYSGSGKTFYLAAEQADLQMRQQPSGKNAAAVTAATPLDADRQEMLGKMWWEQQAAVDDARVDHADKLNGVQVGFIMIEAG